MKKCYKIVFLFCFIVCSAGSAMAQSILISGTVLGDDMKPMPGVKVTIKGTMRGTATNLDGKYIVMTYPTDTLIFEMLGCVAQEIPINHRTEINVLLQPSARMLCTYIPFVKTVRFELKAVYRKRDLFEPEWEVRA